MPDTRLHAFVCPVRIGLATLGSAWLAACAPLAPYNPRLSTQQMSHIGEICHVVMGLPAGPITQYAACVESLSHSFADRRDGGVMLAARHACEARGLEPNTIELSECELMATPDFRTQTSFAPGGDAKLPAKAPKSYFSASNDEVHRRTQEACAKIGYDPISGGFAFARCVADLQSNLFDADNPRWTH